MKHSITITKLDDTTLELVGEIGAEHWGRHRQEALGHLGERVNLPGFRKGHIPEKVLVERLGEMAVLEEMAERAIREAYPEIIVEHKIDAIDRPEISITKIASGNPLGFKIKQSVMPEIKLPDYKKIASEALSKFDKDEQEPEVTDEELAEVLEDIRKSRKIEKLDDESVKTIGKFENLADMRTKLKANLLEEKKMRSKDMRRMSMLESLLAETKFSPPGVMLERQMDRFVNEMKDNVTRMGMEWPKYLEQIKKEESVVREETRSEASKRVRIELLLSAIGVAEKINLTDEELDNEIKHVLEHHKGANPEGVRNYVAGILRNTKVFELLEKLS